MRIIIAFILILNLSACLELIGEKGNGVRITKKITVGDFNRLEVSGSFEVILTEDNASEVTIEIDENLLRFIDVAVRGSSLEIDSDRRLDSKEGVIIKVPVKSLVSLTSSGASNIETTNPLQSDNFSVNSGQSSLLICLLNCISLISSFSKSSL